MAHSLQAPCSSIVRAGLVMLLIGGAAGDCLGSGIEIMLKSVRSGNYLHVAAEHMQPRDPVVQWTSTSEGSQWQVERVGFLGYKVMLTSVRSGLQLHVPSEHVKPRDPVVQWGSTTEGSQWEVLTLSQLAGAVAETEVAVAAANSNSSLPP